MSVLVYGQAEVKLGDEYGLNQSYLLFRVRPRIFVLLGSGMFTEPVRILDLQLCLGQICRLGHF